MIATCPQCGTAEFIRVIQAFVTEKVTVEAVPSHDGQEVGGLDNLVVLKQLSVDYGYATPNEWKCANGHATTPWQTKVEDQPTS
jgi:hypothetical protein